MMKTMSIGRLSAAPWRHLLTGALAGACLVFALMLVAALMLYTGSMFQYTFNSQIPVIQDTAWLAVMQDLGRLPSFFWGWRWLVVGLAVAGALLALLERATQRFPAMWRTRLAVAVVFVVVGTFVVAGLLLRSEQAMLNAEDQSGGLATLMERRPGILGEILTGAVMAIAAAGIVWLGWHWWYERLCRWLRLNAAPDYRDASQGSADQWFERRQEHDKMRRQLLMLLGGSVLLLAASVFVYDQARATVRSGDVWVEPTAPNNSVLIEFARPVRQLLIENTYGVGSATVQLVAQRDKSAVVAPIALEFRDSKVSFERTRLDVAALPAGSYLLNAQLGGGAGGRIGYALIESTGVFASVMALLVGLWESAVLALAVLLVGLRMPQSGSD